MIIRDIEQLRNTDAEVKGENWTSTRLLLKKDNMGFSFHETVIPAGAELHLHYQNHLEAVYCLEGQGTIEDLATNQTYIIKPGIIYALDKHDKHILRARETLRFACVFNPPVTGKETHNAEGSYDLVEE